MAERTREEEYAHWNTPDDTGITLRQREWAEVVGVEPTIEALAVLPCLMGVGPVVCVNGSCVTCEARRRLESSRD